MAKFKKIGSSREELQKIIIKSLQSGNINFLLGSGASSAAIGVAGNIEAELESLIREGKTDEAERKKYKFLLEIQHPTNVLLQIEELSAKSSKSSGELKKVLQKVEAAVDLYAKFIETVEFVLNERKNNLLPKRANLFTTNYDLFIEKAADRFPALRLNDGFQRTSNLKSRYIYSSATFYSSIYNTGNLYSYKAEIPTVNLIKLHGSLSWRRDDGEIVFSTSPKDPLGGDIEKDIAQVVDYNQSYSIVLPEKRKFNETTMDRTYYDLLRIFSNELEREHSLLISYGFSFEDEHIRDIVFRSLKNPTLKLIVVSYSSKGAEKILKMFEGFSNVLVIAPEGDSKNNFETFSELLMTAVAQPVEVKNEL